MTDPSPLCEPVAPPRRVFLSLPLEDTARKAAAQLSANLAKAAQFTAARIAWVPPENYHITLHFLGRLAEEDIERLARAIGPLASRNPPMELKLRGLGYFPAARCPNVLWLGVHRPPVALQQLYRDLRRVVVELGHEPPREDFHPHVTLARFKSQKGTAAFARQAATHRSPDVGITPVRTLDLMESTLEPDGARYTPLARAPLGGEDPPSS